MTPAARVATRVANLRGNLPVLVGLNPVRLTLIGLLRAYRLVISPLYGQVCRFHPTCSAYALGAIERHGALRGSYLAARRLSRCHPWNAGGYDPVPDRRRRDVDAAALGRGGSGAADLPAVLAHAGESDSSRSLTHP
jgi:putative membrane protein insertion efficiency factor